MLAGVAVTQTVKCTSENQDLHPIPGGYVPLASQNPCPIIVYSMANCRPHLTYFFYFHDPNLVTFCLCLLNLIEPLPFKKVILKLIDTSLLN